MRRATERSFSSPNEFFDALPVRQYVRTARGWCERMVTADADGALAFALAPLPVPDSVIPDDRRDAPEGGVCEISPAGLALAGEIACAVAGQGGGALIVDYGYGRPGFGETLQAMADHAFAALLDEPGESDLSAHVDFANLAAQAARGGAAVFGPTPQGAFLEDLGISERVARLAAGNPASAASLRAALDRLTGAGQMGTLFQALAIVPGGAPKPPGF